MDLSNILAVIDISRYLEMSEGRFDSETTALCCKVSVNLKEKGAILVKDPRCSIADNDEFVKMVERYFSSPLDYKLLHQRPGLNYQVLRKTGLFIFLPIFSSSKHVLEI